MGLVSFKHMVSWYTGACEGTLACSTCHLIFSEKDFQMLTKPMSEEEEDMLDLAFGVTKTYVRIFVSFFVIFSMFH